MKAIIIATGLSTNLFGLNERYPVPMLPLVDRPFIQHLVEYLVDRGVTDFDFILNHLPERVETLLGEGTRWGSTFRFHLTRDASRPYASLKTMSDPNETGPILLAHADRLPQLPEELHNHPEQREMPIYYYLRKPAGFWTGWAWLSQQIISKLSGDLDEAGLETELRKFSLAQGAIVEVPRLLSVRSSQELLSANAAVMAREFPGLALSGSEADAGIWVSRNVSLHPTARIVSPVYIGENCRIGLGTQLGPNVVIGANCVLDSRCTVTNSTIFPGSFVGEALELEDVIVDKNLLINARLGATIPVTDEFILGSLSETVLRTEFSRFLSRMAALTLLTLTWPFLLLTAFYLKLSRPGPVLRREDYVKLPAPANEAQWRTLQLWSFQFEGEPVGVAKSRLRDLFLRFLPALINIARGELSFVGVCPRSKEEVKLLPRDWQALYLRSKVGIITEAEVRYGACPDEDELYSAEVFYSATAGVRHDMKLLFSYFGRPLKARTVAAEGPEGHDEWEARKERLSS